MFVVLSLFPRYFLSNRLTLPINCFSEASHWR
uniref:Uncharacterized protein n=1 Tax=Rhizophora mucronata TaxID=61149 RepID=A0A2P2PFQ6_RHIMU